MKSNAYSTSRVGQINKTALAKSPKLTPWFDGSVTPARVGVYRVRASRLCVTGWSWWDGRRWGWRYDTARHAELFRNSDGASQGKEWRGLASNPAKSQR